MFPFLYQSDSLVIPTYIVVNSLVFSLGIFWIYLRAPRFGIGQNNVLDVSLSVMMGIFLGSRLFHILVEHPGFYWEHPAFVFKIWYGGFVYYGGVIGGLIAGLWICHRRKYDFWRLGDVMAPVFAAGYAVGRLGCLAAGCCYGAPTTFPWGIHFPQGSEAPPGIALHPTQIYSSLWETSVLITLLLTEKRKAPKGQVFGLWLALHGLGRALVEQFRDDFRGPSLFNLSVSTWISGIAIMSGIYIVATRRNHASTIV